MGDIEKQTETIRSFNRLYTGKIGIVTNHYLETNYSLTEARVIFEIGHNQKITAKEIIKQIGIDPGQLSRILKNFQKNGLLEKRASAQDARLYILTLTDKGMDEFSMLNCRSRKSIGEMLNTLSDEKRKTLVQSMERIKEIFSEKKNPPFIIRPHRTGDLGWILMRHGEVYSEEYKWGQSFENLVAGVVADFFKSYDPDCERCWIVEKNQKRVGSALLVRENDDTGRIRLLLVNPEERGAGLGKKLVDECISFAGIAGYKKIVLWTNNNLHAARHIYEKAGFKIIKEETHNKFGVNLIGETWELTL